MTYSDLVTSKDGSLSLTKLAASSFHLMICVTVGWVTYIKQDFIVDMWLIYGSFAIGHATVDKTVASVKAFKDKQLDLPPAASVSTTTFQETKTVP